MSSEAFGGFDCREYKEPIELIIKVDDKDKQQRRLKSGICYREGTPLMYDPEAPDEMMPWDGSDPAELCGITYCDYDLTLLEAAYCPEYVLVGGCVDPVAMWWPPELEDADIELLILGNGHKCCFRFQMRWTSCGPFDHIGKERIDRNNVALKPVNPEFADEGGEGGNDQNQKTGNEGGQQ